MAQKYDYWLTDEGLTLAAGWARAGLTDKDIANNIGISRNTLYRWMKQFPAFAEAVTRNKEAADIVVENALYKSACGFMVEEVIRERVWDPDSHSWQMLPVKIHTKYIPPSNTAQIFWLKNRQPERWRDRYNNPSAETDENLGTVILPEKREEPVYDNNMDAST